VNSRTRSILLVCLLPTSLLAVAPAMAAKDKGDPFTHRIEKERRALEKLKDEIQEKKKQSGEVEKKKESVVQTIEELDGRLMRSREQYRDINRKLKHKDRELEQINGQIVALRADIADRRSSILERLRLQYVQGRFGYLRTLLAARDYADFQRRFQYLSAVSKREYDLVQAFRADVDRLGAMERQRLQARNEMLAFKQATERRLEEIGELKRHKQALVVRFTQEKEAYDHAVAELERSAARVDSLLREMEERRRAAAARPRGYEGRPHPAKGVLPWPVDGPVVSQFGRQKHPTFDTYVQKKGIEIRTQEGSAIRAVMAGAVAYADWLKGYGLVIILDHLNGYFSLYAHASKVLTKVGEHVQAGHIIAETGDTGLTGESTLYFELREGAEPVDPLAWLARR